MPDTHRIVLDTSCFTNPTVAKSLGGDTTAAVNRFLELARLLRGRVGFYMPPSVLAELQHFTDTARLAPDLELVVQLRAPRRHAVMVPGGFLYELIDDIRARIDRGLRVAESAVREVEPASVERTIARLRERYRGALRTGLLDSSEDVDVILLAMELDGAVASADQGLSRWAERLGLRLIPPERLAPMLEALVEDALAADQR
mgnify:CR=1 FL=1